MMNPMTPSKATPVHTTPPTDATPKATSTSVTPPVYTTLKAAPVVTPRITHDGSTGEAAEIGPGVVAARKSTHENIARRAHEIYVKKGCPAGQNEQNWLQAEKELGHQNPATRPAK